MSEPISKEELNAMRGRCHNLLDGIWREADMLEFARFSRRNLPRLLDAYEALLAALSDPAAVWTNMLRGTIARPGAFAHTEEQLCECQAKLAAAEKALAEMTELASKSSQP